MAEAVAVLFVVRYFQTVVGRQVLASTGRYIPRAIASRCFGLQHAVPPALDAVAALIAVVPLRLHASRFLSLPVREASRPESGHLSVVPTALR